MERGLILEGGAMRGMFTAGVLDVFMENGVELDGVIGVSAGAAFGCNYKSRQHGRVLRYNTKYVRDKRYCGLGVLLKTGDIFSADFCYNEIPLIHDPFDFDTFEKNPVEFYAVCTDLETGSAVYKRLDSRRDNCLEWIRASASMPLVSRIVEIDGQKLLDGGIADSIP
ncbi:MAG: patatin family protein, partial [Clostridia bacterium]|nr:patatin family protein [Clostridia bacterium]